MLTKFVLALLLAFPSLLTKNNVDKLCIDHGYFAINWNSYPVTVCESISSTGKITGCFLMNPFDRDLRAGDPYVRVYADGMWFFDFGQCWNHK